MSILLLAMLMGSVGPMGPDAPAREPQLVSQGARIMMTFGAGKVIYFAVSKDKGATFSAPVKVSEAAVLPLTRHRGPRIAVAGNVIIITAVIGKTLSEGQHAHGLPSDGDLVAWRSTDNGQTWSKGSAIDDVAGAASEGLHTLASDSKGTLFAAWLDKRSGKGTAFYGAKSTDGGLHWSKNVLIYNSPEGTICECCHPSSAIDADGHVLVMWRNWLNGARDMYLAKSIEGSSFTAPEKLGMGTWKVNACPMDGGGLVIAGNKIVTAWRRESDVYLDEPGKPELHLGAGKDIAIAASGNKVFVIWSSTGEIQLWNNGTLNHLAKDGAVPTLVGLPGGAALAAWEENGAIVTRTF